MASETTTIYKELSISRVPRALYLRLKKDAEQSQVSVSVVARDIFRRYYGLTPERKNSQ